MQADGDKTDDKVTLKLALQSPAGGDEDPIEKEFPIAGGWSTEWLEFSRGEGSWPDPVFLFGADSGGHGRKKFTLKIENVTDFEPVTLHKNTLDAAQFLSFNQPGLDLKYTRLNSLFGPELVQRSNISVDAVLDWDTQFLEEPLPQGRLSFWNPTVLLTAPTACSSGSCFFMCPTWWRRGCVPRTVFSMRRNGCITCSIHRHPLSFRLRIQNLCIGAVGR